MPSVLKRVFAEAGRDIKDELDLIALDPQWRSFFDDGSTLDLHADAARMVENLSAFGATASDQKGYQRFLDDSKRLDDISQRYFFWRFDRLAQGHVRPLHGRECGDLGRCVANAAVEHRRGHDPIVCRRSSSDSDARPFHSIRRVITRTSSRGALRDRPHANRPGGSGIPEAAPAPWPKR